MISPLRHWRAVLASFLGLLPLQAAPVENGSFELNQFTASPGYASANGGVIQGWTFSGGAGLNRAGEPFADNGKVPDGFNVAFLQGESSLFTTISGLTPGQPYVLQFRTNRRAGTGEPVASYSLGGGPPVSFAAGPAVGGTNPYRTVKAAFVPSGETLAFQLKNQSTVDSALLVDDVRVHVTTGSKGTDPVVLTPAVAMTWMMCAQGAFPTAGATSDTTGEAFLGEVRLFATTESHMMSNSTWLPCDGRELQIAQNPALFYLLSTTHGGNGMTTFRIPDMRGRSPMGAGAGPGLTPRSVGQSGNGSKLTAVNLPPHRHALANGTTEEEGESTPFLAVPPFLVLQPFLIQAGDPNATAAVRWYAGVNNTPGLPCDGASLDTGAYQELYEQLGHIFGGSGDQFRVPDLRGRIVIGEGQGTGRTPRVLGESGGPDGLVVPASALPGHVHGLPPGFAGNTGATGSTSATAPFAVASPFVVLNAQVAVEGVYQRSANTPAIGEVRWFATSIGQMATFGASYWAPCDGSVATIADHSSYVVATPTVWGGNEDSRPTPDLRGRMSVGTGQAGTLPVRALADAFGSDTFQLTAATLPAHFHAVDTTTGTRLSRRHGVNDSGISTLNLVAKVTSAFSTPTGTVALYQGNTLLESRPLDAAGIADFSNVTPTSTESVLHFRYLGDANFTSSRSLDYIHRGAWSVQSWLDDEDTGISSEVTSWAYRFFSTTQASIGGKTVTGLAGTNPAVAGEFSTSGMGLAYTGDTNALTALTGSGSAEIAKSFVYNGNPGTITLQGLKPGNTYVLSMLSVGFDPVSVRRSTFASGSESLVVNQGQYGNDQGIRVDHVFKTFSTTHSITITPEDPGRSFHLYAMALRRLGGGLEIYDGSVPSAGDRDYGVIGTVKYPRVMVGQTGDSRTFTLVNTSRSSVGLGLSRLGPNQADFRVASPAQPLLGPGEATTFSVTFAPEARKYNGGFFNSTMNVTGAARTLSISFSGEAEGNPTYPGWVHGRGLIGENADFDADPNGNGVPNVLEFLLGGEPALPGTMPPLPTIRMTPDFAAFSFRRMMIAYWLNPVLVEFSDSPAGPWTRAVDNENARFVSSYEASVETVTVFIARSGAGRMFVRLRVGE